jgi:hypothetical protein
VTIDEFALFDAEMLPLSYTSRAAVLRVGSQSVSALVLRRKLSTSRLNTFAISKEK